MRKSGDIAIIQLYFIYKYEFLNILLFLPCNSIENNDTENTKFIPAHRHFVKWGA